MENYFKKFYKELINHKLNIDGIAILKGDKIISKAFIKPYQENHLHRMYSVTKSLTMIGIGLLVTNNLIDINDKIVSFYDFEVLDPLIKEMTIKDLLTMKTTFTKTTYNKSSDSWLLSFFNTPSSKIPGTIFSYDTSASYVLSSLIEKLTKMDMLDYIKQYFEFSKESYIIKSKEGISHGGSGFMGTINDLILLLKIIKNDGLGIINKDFIIDAKSFQSNTTLETTGHEFNYGYGYHLWLNSKKGFMLIGMYGQIAYYDFENDLSLITLSNLSNQDNGISRLLSIYHKHITSNINNLNINNLYLYEDNRFKELIFKKESFNYLYQTSLGKVSLIINDDVGSININNKVIHFSLKNYIEDIFPKTKETYISQGKIYNNKLYIELYLVGEELGYLDLDIYFNEKEISIVSKAKAEKYLMKWNFNLKGKRLS